MRSLFTWILAAVLFVTPGISDNKSLTVSSLNEALSAEKMLVCLDKNTGENMGGGSGSIIWSAVDREWLILSAHHVVWGCENSGGANFVFHEGEHLKLITVKLDAQHDLALVKTEKVFKSAIKFFSLSLKEVIIADTVYTIGFPGPYRIGPDVIVTKGIVNSPLAKMHGCLLPKEGEPLIRLVWDCGQYSAVKTIILSVLLSDAQIGPGNSGGAIVNDSFELIGVTVGGVSMANWRGFSVPLIYINDLLNSTEYSFLVGGNGGK